MTTQSQRIIEFLADLAGSNSPRANYRIDPSTFRWLPLSYTKVLRGEPRRRGEPGPLENGFPEDRLTDKIFKTARLHEEEGLLRVGWMWVVGKDPEYGSVFCPLAAMPVQVPPLRGVSNTLSRVLRSGYKFADVIPAGELEVSELVADPVERDELSEIPLGDSLFRTMASHFVSPGTKRTAPMSTQQTADLRQWAVRAAGAAGLRTTRIVGAERDLAELAIGPLVIVLGVGLYVGEPDSPSSRVTTEATLRSWAEHDVEGTALAHLYSDDGDADLDDGDRHADESVPWIPSSLLLNPAQRRVVESTRHRRLTVVSGPPGTGKSQTVVATALDHVRAGRSVLLAAPTDAAVSALVALLEAAPGPDPIVFGASAKRLDVANRLAEGAGPWFDDDAVKRSQNVLDRAQQKYEQEWAQIVGLLRVEATGGTDPAKVLLARQQAPGLFDLDADLYGMRELAERAQAGGGWFTRRRAAKALAKLQIGARCDRTISPSMIAELVAVATARQRVANLESSGGLRLS